MKKHKLYSLFFAATLVAASAVNGVLLFIPKVHAAAPAYNYVINNDNCLPYVPTAQCVADISIVSGDATQQIYGGGVFSYKSGSTYDFTSGGGTIHVTYNDPSHGILTSTQGSKQTITIGSPGNFTGYFVNGQVPESPTTAVININLDINFGAQDPSLQVGKVDLSVKASTSVASSTKSTDPNPTTLTSNIVNYSNSFSPEGAGSYSVCATANFIIATNNQVCKDVAKVAGKPLSVSLSANGDPSKFQTSKDATDVGCESQGGPLSWIMCPIIKGLSEAIDSIYGNMIQPLLKTQPLNPSTSDPTHTYQIWSNFRVFGDIFLIIALLVVVFGESLGGGLIDAYSAKKILPRLLIAAIAINLSIYIVALAVDVTNILGNGIADLILQPFSSIPKGLDLQMGWMSSGLLLGGLVGGAIWAGSLGAALLEFLFAFLLLPAFLLFLAIMAVVILRRALIIILVILAPVAFALYCLPNTEKYFKKWWETLFKTLLIYPLIAVLFAVSKIVAFTLESGTQGQGVTPAFAQLMGTIALFVPLFLIPFSFKIAGGILGQVHEVMHGAGKRAHQGILGNANDPDSWRNRARRGLFAKNAERNMSARAIGATLSPRTAFSRKQRQANRAAVRNMYQSVYGKQGMGQQMYEANKDDSNVTGDLAKYATGEKSRAAAYEDFNRRYNKDGTLNEAYQDKAQLQQRLFSSAAADRIGRDVAMRRRALMNPATIGYQLEPGKKGWDQADEIMRQLSGFTQKTDGTWSGGDEGTYRSMMNEFQYVAKSAAGRTDLAAAVDGGDYNGYRAWTQLGMYQHGNGKPASIKGSAQYFSNLWDRAQGGADALTPQDIQNFAGVSESDFKALSADQQAAARERARASALDSVAIFSRELNNMGDSATGSVRDESLKQLALLKDKGGIGLESRMEKDNVKKAARGYDRDEMRLRNAGELS